VLPAAVVSRSDVIGAAQTGSGKTLAFGLPIIQVLLQEREALAAAGREDPHAGKLRALVICPTRELALQVAQHISEVSKPCGVRVAAIVGGLAQVKQERVLALSPQVVVATPGRLWELMREGQPLLSDFSHLSFLVLDEADRMLAQGHFQELTSILDQVPRSGQQRANTYDPDFEEAFAAETGRRREGKTGKGAKGRKGEVEVEEVVDEEAEDEGADDAEEGEDEDAGAAPSASAPERAAVPGAAQKSTKGQLMQTMVFSATLTLPANLRKRLRAGGGGSGGGASLESLIDKMHFRGDPRIVDLTTTMGSKLVATVRESYLNCTNEERDEVGTSYA
jgi:superfamily II DNA/RNA helicase